MTPEQLIALKRVETVVPSPDGTWLCTVVQRLDEKEQKYVHDLWRVPTDGSEAMQLTSGSQNDKSPAFRADGGLMFLSDRKSSRDDEDERFQVWMFQPTGGDPMALTDEPLGVAAFVLAKSADVFVVKSTRLAGIAEDKQRETAKQRSEQGPTAIHYKKMPVRFWDHWLPDIETHFAVYRDGNRQPLFSDDSYRDAAFSMSDDGGLLCVSRRGEQQPDRLYDSIAELWDIRSLDRIDSQTESKTTFDNPVFGAGEVYLERTRRDGNRAPWTDLVRWAFDSVGWEAVIDDFESKSLVGLVDEGTLLISGNHEGTTPVWLYDLRSGVNTRITSASAAGTHTSVSYFESDHGPHICGVRCTLTQAPEPFVAPLAEEAEPQIAANISGWHGPTGVSASEARATSTDGENIHYYVVGPEDSDERPALLWIHGGPMSAWGDVWHWRWNSLIPAAKGYRVILPNPRGSTGYGYEFRNGIWGNVWGAQCFEDLMAVTDEVAARHDVDENRLVAMGGSFGGYMTNWIGGVTNRFKCLVTHAGLASFETFHGITDNPAWWSAMFGLDPLQDLEELRLYSPISNIKDWTAPTLIIHGGRDYRVPVGEALLLFEGLQKYGVESELLLFPDENHWILRPQNILSWYHEFLTFTDHHT